MKYIPADKSLKHEIPDVVLMPYHISESALPTIIEPGIYGYADGKDRRRARREQERKNKKK